MTNLRKKEPRMKNLLPTRGRFAETKNRVCQVLNTVYFTLGYFSVTQDKYNILYKEL